MPYSLEKTPINEAQVLLAFCIAFEKKYHDKFESYKGPDEIFFKARWFRNQIKEKALCYTELDLIGSDLEHLPCEIKYFTNLTELYLSDNPLPFLPESIGVLTNLQILKISGNLFETTPEISRQMINLT